MSFMCDLRQKNTPIFNGNTFVLATNASRLPIDAYFFETETEHQKEIICLKNAKRNKREEKLV